MTWGQHMLTLGHCCCTQAPERGQVLEGACSFPVFLGQPDSLHVGATQSSDAQRAQSQVQAFHFFIVFIVSLLENLVRRCTASASGADVQEPVVSPRKV